MYVVKRNGRHEPVSFDKITSRIHKLCYGMTSVEPITVAQKVVQGVYRGVTTTELDELAAEIAAQMSSQNYEYAKLAARIAVSNMHKNTKKSFSRVTELLRTYVEPKTGLPAPLVSDAYYQVVKTHAEALDAAIMHSRDFEYDYFGYKTLEKSYLLKVNQLVAERPQHMLMRTAVGMHMNDVEAAIETYRLLAEGWFTHASPTLFNAGMENGSYSSCFLLTMKADSIEGIYDTLKQTAVISKSAGGVGLSVSDVRASGSYIRGTNGTSNGLIPMLRVFNNTARYVDQGGGKRKGAFAMYLEPWHADVLGFLELKQLTGAEELRAKDLFYGLWIPDLFMKRVEADGVWSLMCPNQCPGLTTTYGEAFEELYQSYERGGRFLKQVQARSVWQAILKAQVETGGPYMLYKDHVNRKNQQANLGVIKSSNLCVEIVEYTDPDQVAVCNLASIALPKFVQGTRFHLTQPYTSPVTREAAGPRRLHDTPHGSFDHEALARVVKVAVRNLNRVIDVTFYPVAEAKHSNLQHRPIGIGVQGLADVFHMLHMPFASPEAQVLNREIFETMYYAALEASCELAERDGPYASFAGSPASRGVLQYDLWQTQPSGRWNFAALKERIVRHGLRNSLLLALMPTASTSQILGNSECIEPLASNLYLRRTMAGEFCVVNWRLMHDLVRLKLWTNDMRQAILAANGSIQTLTDIPEALRALYKTVWEIPARQLVDMAADRGAFVDQSQSFNLNMANHNYGKLTSFHFYCWEKGLKTGMYYFRTQETQSAKKTTVELVEHKVATAPEEITAPLPPAWLDDEEARSPRQDTDRSSRQDVVRKGLPGHAEARSSGHAEADHKEVHAEPAVDASMVCSLDNRDACVSCGS